VTEEYTAKWIQKHFCMARLQGLARLQHISDIRFQCSVYKLIYLLTYLLTYWQNKPWQKKQKNLRIVNNAASFFLHATSVW